MPLLGTTISATICYAAASIASSSSTTSRMTNSVSDKFSSAPLITRPQLSVDHVIVEKHNDLAQSMTSLAPSDTSILDISGKVVMTRPQENIEESTDEYLFILPFIVLFGLCGNTISLIAIFHSRLRKMAANQYLIVLTLADSVFLLGVIMVLFKVDFTGYFPCVSIEYVLMCASYISSWSITALTIERYLAIAHPLKHVQYGYVSRWKMMCFWVPIPFVLNLVQFITLTPNLDPTDPNWPNVRKCTVQDGQLQMIVELIDVVLCYMLPCFIVVVLNLLIASKVELAEKTFAKTSVPSQKPSTTNSPVKTTEHHSKSSPKTNIANGHDTFSQQISISMHQKNDPRSCRHLPKIMKNLHNTSDNNNNNNSSSIHNGNNVVQSGGSSTSASGSTRILLAVPIVYILLNTPFYMIRIIDTIALNIFHCKAFSIHGGLTDPLIVSLYNTAHYLYYINFACDFVVYAFSSTNFRRTVVSAWRRLLCSKWAKESDYLESIARSAHNRCNANPSQEHAIQKIRLIGPSSTSSITQMNPCANEIVYKPTPLERTLSTKNMRFHL